MRGWLKGLLGGIIFGVISLIFFISSNVVSVIKTFIWTIILGIIAGIILEKISANESLIGDHTFGKFGLALVPISALIIPYSIFLMGSILIVGVFLSFFVSLISLVCCIIQYRKKRTRLSNTALVLSIILSIILLIWAVLLLFYAIAFWGAQ